MSFRKTFSLVVICFCIFSGRSQSDERNHSQYYISYGPCFSMGTFASKSGGFNELGKGKTGYILKVAADKFIQDRFFAGVSFARTENKAHNDTLTARIAKADRGTFKEISKNTEDYFQLGISRINLSFGVHGSAHSFIWQARINAALCLLDYSFEGSFYIPDSVPGSVLIGGYPKGTLFRYSGSSKPFLTIVPEISFSYPVLKMARSELRLLISASYFFYRPTIQIMETVDDSGLGTMINPPAEEIFKLNGPLSLLTLDAGFSLILKKK